MRIAADGSVRTQRYWDVFDHLTPLTDRSEDEVAALLIDELRTSVDLRKVADVPMGVFLSGGVDSSTNLALFAEGRPEPVHTFSIGYAGSYDSYPDELPYAREVARTFGAQYHERLLTVDDFVDFLPQMIHLQDEPIGDPVCVPVYYVSKLARDAGVIVAQVGEGSDELFFGYPAWKRALAVQNFCNLPGASSIAGLGDWVLGRTPKRNSLYRDWLRRAAMDQPVFWGGVDVFGAEQKNRILHPRLRERFAGDSSWEVIEPIYNRFVDKAWDASALNWMTYIDLNMRLPELLLMRVDKMSMGASLEARVPFLDHKFCELAMSIPSEMKLRNGNGKHILK
jgi:asparagine synthase (glutamine-hydrolysing)